MSHTKSPKEAVEVAPQPFDEKETYYPLFVLQEAPDEYFHALNLALKPDDKYLSITSSNPSLPTLISEIKSHLDSTSTPHPFLRHTVPQAYSFFKSTLRSPEDSNHRHPFTHFCFFAVDRESVSPSSSPLQAVENPYPPSAPYTILLCCDAPDYHEFSAPSHPKLKTLRLPLVPEALHYLYSLEGLLMTPSEVHKCVFRDPEAGIAKLVPPATLWPVPPFDVPSDEQEYRLATPREARGRKREGLAQAEAASWGGEAGGQGDVGLGGDR
ncbi:MAG: hypothetical protein LQ351_004106 [Letrouitia transgressa]|nr:MAG: hypothetical protein LQ351_004106 [Letrouitia transgressa]